MININNIAITSIRLGLNLVQKIYSGSVLIYNASATPSFDYVYHIMGLTYVSEVKNDIYGLHYDLLGSSSVVVQNDQSYTYESLEKTYSWF
jgi:hypothetical protein